MDGAEAQREATAREGDRAAGGGANAAKAKRRGTGALFPAGWSVFLLVATALTVLRAGSPAGLPVAAARTPARDLFGVVALGVCILWPMIRLSQMAAPGARGRARAALGDVFVVVAPSATVVLASQLVVGWGWERAGAVTLMLASWAALVGALIAIGTGWKSGAARGAWMALIVVASLGAPGAMTLAAPATARGERALMLASPVTGVYAITASGSGAALPAGREAWVAAAAPGAVAIPLWAVAWAGGRRRTPGTAVH